MLIQLTETRQPCCATNSWLNIMLPHSNLPSHHHLQSNHRSLCWLPFLNIYQHQRHRIRSQHRRRHLSVSFLILFEPKNLQNSLLLSVNVILTIILQLTLSQ